MSLTLAIYYSLYITLKTNGLLFLSNVKDNYDKVYLNNTKVTISSTAHTACNRYHVG